MRPLHANLRGAAIFASLSLGVVTADEVNELVPVERVFEPNPSRRAIYDELFAEFPRLYKAQRHMFSRLNKPQRR